MKPRFYGQNISSNGIESNQSSDLWFVSGDSGHEYDGSNCAAMQLAAVAERRKQRRWRWLSNDSDGADIRGCMMMVIVADVDEGLVVTLNPGGCCMTVTMTPAMAVMC